jgi:hypothetical protein
VNGVNRVQWSRPTRAALAAAILATLLAGCRAPHPGVSNGSVSACYRAIPTARAAAGDKHATLIGVHRIPVDRVLGNLPASAQTVVSSDDDSTVCVVSLKGDFGPGQVQLAPSDEQGRYAVILLTSRHLKLVASAVVSDLPKAFGGRVL